MQTVSAALAERATKSMRRVSWRLMMSFDKTLNPSLAFFALDTSQLDGTAVLAPPDSDVVQEWDKYLYTDYSDRVVSLEWSRQDDLPSAVSLAMADIVLDNHDGYFSRGSGSAVDGLVLPKRPLRILAGFGNEVIPQFVGLTEAMPTIDKGAGTASFHCIDFLSSIFNRPLNQTLLMLDVRTDEVLDALFQNVGLIPAQYVLDQGINQIPIVFFQNDIKLGDAVKQLMDAESGRLYMDELGIIRFRRRTSVSAVPVYTFDASNTIEKQESDQSNIINVVDATAQPRAVQDKQPVWQQADFKTIPSSSSIALWADLSDPTTFIDLPVVGVTPSASYIVVRDGPNDTDTEVTSDIVISSPFLFGLSYQVTVTNNNAFPVYVMASEFWGTPALVVDKVATREQDDDSVAKYDEQPYTINSDFIQSEDAARSLSLSILHQFADYASVINLNVKGTPALQMADALSVHIDSTAGLYNITGLACRIASPAFEQRVRATQLTTFAFFVLDTSILDGPEVLSP